MFAILSHSNLPRRTHRCYTVKYDLRLSLPQTCIQWTCLLSLFFSLYQLGFAPLIDHFSSHRPGTPFTSSWPEEPCRLWTLTTHTCNLHQLLPMRDIYGDVTFHDPRRCHAAQHSGRNIFMKDALAVLCVALTSSPRTLKYPDNATLVHAARRYHSCAVDAP